MTAQRFDSVKQKLFCGNRHCGDSFHNRVEKFSIFNVQHLQQFTLLS